MENGKSGEIRINSIFFFSKTCGDTNEQTVLTLKRDQVVNLVLLLQYEVLWGLSFCYKLTVQFQAICFHYLNASASDYYILSSRTNSGKRLRNIWVSNNNLWPRYALPIEQILDG